MRILLLLLLFVTVTAASTITLKDDSSYEGQIICQKRTTITMKTAQGTIGFMVRTIKSIDSLSMENAKKIVLPQGTVDPKRNEIRYINSSIDTVTIRLRDSTKAMVGEANGAPGDTISFVTDNGVFFESVQYHRGVNTYYLKGHSFNVSAPCNSFQKLDIVLHGAPAGSRPPQLKSLKNLFDLP